MENKKVKAFLIKNKENGDYNQYWYSDKSIQFLANQASKYERCCFLSTPSIFYAMENPDLTKPYYVFDFDMKFGNKNPKFVHYDFNHPEKIPAELHHSFDFIIADPPFITHQVWALYKKAIDLLKAPNCAILCSTIVQNEAWMKEQLGLSLKKWKPSIPHLVYQYGLYGNYENEELEQINQEVAQ